MDINPVEGLARIKKYGELDRIEKETINFHERVHAGYMEIIKQDPDRFFVVDGNKSIDVLSQEIRMYFDNWLSLRIEF